MPKTVVGLFSSTTEAQNVRHELVGQGYPATDIRVMTTDVTSPASKEASDSSTGTGLGATISNFFRSLTGGDEEAERHYAAGLQQGGALLSVTVPDGRENQVADLLAAYGAKNVNDQSSGASSAAALDGLSKHAVSEGGSVPIVEETMQVGKQQVQRGGVRVYSHLVERPVEENIVLQEEHVRVDRQKVNRPASEADFNAFKEGTIELTETAEEAVVSKTARIVEEIVVGKEASERTQTIRDTVRHTEVEVEQLGAGTSRPSSRFADYDFDFRNHFKANYGSAGKPYDTFAPAYQYGHTLASDPRYASNDWSSVESAAQRGWTAQGSGKWEDFKGAVQEGWNKVRTSATTPKR